MRDYQLGQKLSQNPLKYLLLLIGGVSLISAVYDHFFTHFFSFPNPSIWLSLSSWGVKKYFVWQIFTYPFVHSNLTFGLSLSFAIHLLFNLYLLFLFGTGIYERYGKKHFFGLFFGGSFFTGLIIFFYISLSPSLLLFAGPSAPLYSLMVAWAMIFSENTLLLFFSFRIKAKWLVLGLVGLNVFFTLVDRNLLYFCGYLAGIFFGYFYAVIIWRTHSPFAILRKLEKALMRASFKLKKFFIPYSRRTKIIDISIIRQSQTDEEFIDYCLAKISSKGTNALSWNEKRRMNKISKKKQR
ncbi:MAG: rhomboid family intramembrane serine protease [Simkaniaceae bacterium]|nr:rhomboid family intramembrane serine protease [Simkaniaceae bacterium]